MSIFLESLNNLKITSTLGNNIFALLFLVIFFLPMFIHLLPKYYNAFFRSQQSILNKKKRALPAQPPILVFIDDPHP
jgi:hypothetical protein